MVKKTENFFDAFSDSDSEDPLKTEKKEMKDGANRLGFSSWGEDKVKPAFDKSVLGICFDCQKLQCYKTTWGNMGAKCYDFEIRINPQDPIEDCTNYYKDKQLSLDQLASMAIIINTNGSKKEIGFITKEDAKKEKKIE